MSSVTESNLGLNYGWAYGESGWNTGMDDNLVKLGFTSRNQVKGILSAPPSTPSNGDAYIVGTAPTGLFSGKFANIAIYDRGSWVFITPKSQEVVFNTSDGCDYIYNNSWSLKLEAEVSPYIKIKDFTFSTGYTITDQKQCLLNITDNHYYQWNGTLPKVVSAGSTPATDGGIGAGAWVDKTDLMLRSELNIINSTFNSVSEMKLADLKAGSKATTKSYRWLSQADTFGAAEYVIVTAADFGSTPDGYGDHLSSNGNVAKLIRKGPPNVAQYGAYANDATKNSTAAFNAAKIAAGVTEPVEMPFATYYVNLTSWTKAIKGNGATLRRFDSSTEYAINFAAFTPYWQFKQVLELVIDGVDNTHEGAAIGATPDALAGRWAFFGCSFINSTKGLRKYAGNIGNRFINCLFKSNLYGFFACDSSTGTAMHTGADYWEGNHVESNSISGVYYKDATDGYGQHIFKANIFEANGGFGLVIRNTTANGSVPFVDIALENNWFEANATLATVSIDDLGSVIPQNRYFVGVRSLYIKGEYVFKSKFECSNVTLDDCRVDASYTNTRNNVSILNTSRIRANNATAATFGGIKAYIESYKRIPNSGTIAQGGMASWAPNRVAISAAGSGTLLNVNSINLNSAINFTGSVGVNSTPITPGFLGAAVHQVALPASSTHHAGSAVNSTSGKYFVATIMMRVISGDATKLSASWSGASGSLGPIYIDTETPAAWKCCAVIGLSAGQTSPRASFVNSDTSTITIQVADQQVIEFTTENEAIDFYNSRLFKQYV